jgi:murein L,D-transpeptidase YcbB/YkuD
VERILQAVLRVGRTRTLTSAALALALLAAPSFGAAEYGSAADLEKALERLRAPETKDGWASVGAGPALKRDARGERVERLQKRLRAGGDLTAPSAAGSLDAATEDALRRFQARHGLDVDGIAGADTIEALDRPLDELVRDVEANLTARRAFESRAAPRFVLVNVPDYRLTLVENGASTLTMKVAVGEEGWATPPIDEQIRTIVVNPVWKLPATIVAADLAPKVRANPRYLEENGYLVLPSDEPGAKPVDPERVDWKAIDPEKFRYLVRQQPGPENRLGAFKFLFPNREDIYLHDTPEREVFERTKRHVSHGCIRVERALDLAVELLRDTPGWSREQLGARVDSGKSEDVALAHPVPIYLVYWTAWVAPDGTLQQRRDIYGNEVDPDTTPL